MLVPELAARALRGLRVIDLHEPHAALGQPAGHQALRGRRSSVDRVVEAVEPLRRRRLGRRRRTPRAPRPASGRPARTTRSGRRAGCRPRAPLRCSSLSRCSASSCSRCAAERESPGSPRFAIGSFRSATSVPWYAAGRKLELQSGAPCAGWRGADDDEAGQVLVLAPQAVEQPRAQARPRERLLARVHLEAGAVVVDVVGDHRADDAQVVDARRRRSGTAR